MRAILAGLMLVLPAVSLAQSGVGVISAGGGARSGAPVAGCSVINAVLRLDGSLNMDCGAGLTYDGSALKVRSTVDANLLANSVGGEVALQAVNDAGTANVPMRLYSTGFTFFGGGVTIGGSSITGTTVAATINNGTSTGNILNVQDNGSNVFTVADGGAVISGPNQAASPTNIGATFNIGRQFTTVAAGPTGTTVADEYLHLGAGSYGADSLSTIGFGTAQGAGTSRGPMAFGYRQTSTADQGAGDSFLRLKSSFVSTDTQYTRQYVQGINVTLTESAATTVSTFTMPADGFAGGVLSYCVAAVDTVAAPDERQVRCGQVRWQAINVASTETCAVLGVDNAFTANPSETADGSGAGVMSSGTLTYGWTAITTGTNQCALQLNAVSSLTQTSLVINVQHQINGVVSAVN